MSREADCSGSLAWRAPPLPAVSSPSLLHTQLERLAELAIPTEADSCARERVASRVARLVQRSLGRSAHPTLFGSSTTGLALPLSDLDVHVSVAGCSSAIVPLSLVDEYCQRKRGLALDGRVEFVRGAKVPIVSFVEARSGLGVDISANAPSGLRTSEAARAALNAMPVLRPLILALKIGLGQHGLNKPRYGGIGSHMLFAMVHTALCGQLSSDLDLGTLLQDVLARYARQPGLRCAEPASGQECGGAAWAWPSIRNTIEEWSRRLAAHGCLSGLLEGWPQGGLLESAEQLRSVCEVEPPRAPRVHRGSFSRSRSRSPGRSRSRSPRRSRSRSPRRSRSRSPRRSRSPVRRRSRSRSRSRSPSPSRRGGRRERRRGDDFAPPYQGDHEAPESVCALLSHGAD